MISVIIPVFNGEAYIAETIESVLGQTPPPGEVLIVDDGSTDGTADVIHGFGSRVQYQRQPNQGPGAARNLGIQTAAGDMLAFLDADDVWMPDKLKLQAAALDQDPALDLVFCHMSQFISPDLAPATAATLIADGTSRPAPLISCLLARRTAFDRVGLLRTDIKTDFVDWYLRAQEASLHMRTLDDLLVTRRIHSGNFTLKHRDIRVEYLGLLKASLDRRRAAVRSEGKAPAVSAARKTR